MIGLERIATKNGNFLLKCVALHGQEDLTMEKFEELKDSYQFAYWYVYMTSNYDLLRVTDEKEWNWATSSWGVAPEGIYVYLNTDCMVETLMQGQPSPYIVGRYELEDMDDAFLNTFLMSTGEYFKVIKNTYQHNMVGWCPADKVYYYHLHDVQNDTFEELVQRDFPNYYICRRYGNTEVAIEHKRYKGK